MKNTLTKIFFSVFLISFFSCKDSQKQIGTKEKKASIEIASKSDINQLNDSLSKKVVHEFYKWYVNDVYFKRIYDYNHAKYKKYDKNKYGLDVPAYRDKINGVKYFSNKFKSSLVERNERCNDEMLKFNWDFEPEPNFNIPACSFIWDTEWFGSQENLDKNFKILNDFIKKDSYYEYTVQSYLNNKPLFQYNIEVIKEDDSFKINSIQRK